MCNKAEHDNRQAADQNVGGVDDGRSGHYRAVPEGSRNLKAAVNEISCFPRRKNGILEALHADQVLPLKCSCLDGSS